MKKVKEVPFKLDAKGAKSIVTKYVRSKNELKDILVGISQSAHRGRKTVTERQPSDFTIKELVKLGFRVDKIVGDMVKIFW